MTLHAQFARPRNLEQAVALLENLGAGTVLIAGGQEIMPHVNYGRLRPAVFVDINALPELAGIGTERDVVRIGALTVHRQLQRDPIITQSLPLLASAAAQIGGGWQVHNRGTVGGNIAALHPLYDIIPPLMALEAEVEIASTAGVSRVPLGTLVHESARVLGAAGVLTGVLVKPQRLSDGWSYQKLKMVEGSYGSANAAAIVALDSARRIVDLRVVIGAVSERPLDVSEPLRHLALGRSYDERLAGEVEQTCRSLVTQPLADQQGGAEYRVGMAGVMARRAVETALRCAAASV
ncbi:MAG: FAD binding domain-containing protein [Steroidobacteraceae bacterium]|nr:FAD binding domain-containing protein [Steroidobacteraceae bacterium]MDW8259783.1 FAD binding domain-containing protein [Gammaproteobacteria bacterium]